MKVIIRVLWVSSSGGGEKGCGTGSNLGREKPKVEPGNMPFALK